MLERSPNEIPPLLKDDLFDTALLQAWALNYKATAF
ncbi:hypothetical protein DFR28_102955 [Arenicella xantha]|uniref:Uncharacterized protein n=1 Tax=Arenicella xantha TaxID=644221 RepID=A0A395JM83_9GAMM|nr:hypothetical protein DFR28_102955 [Arenicella xantha]